MRIETTTWKTFTYPEIFVICKGFYNKKPEHSEKGCIPFLGAVDGNNGVTEYYTYDEIASSTKTGNEPNNPIEQKLFPPNAVCVTNNGSVGYAYYQPSSFTCSHDVNPLYRKDGDFNEFTGLFVATVIMHDRYRWEYGRKWRPMRMEHSTIKLPVTDAGKPDWKWMETYIASLYSKPLRTKNISGSINASEWKAFPITSLFEYFEIGKANACILEEGGDCPYLGAKKSENCIMFYCKPIPDLMHKGNCVVFICNGEGSVGYTNYMDRDFIASTDLVMGYGKNINKYTGLFICTVLDKERPKYSFGRKWKTHIKDTIIKLPCDSSGNPDWNYMENYIKKLPYGDCI